MTKQQVLKRLKAMERSLNDNEPFTGRAEMLRKIRATLDYLERYKTGSFIEERLNGECQREFLELHGCREDITPEEYFDRMNTKLISELQAVDFEEAAKLIKEING